MADTPTEPVIIVVGSPHVPKGPVTLRCQIDTCRRRCAAQMSTAKTITQLREQNVEFLLICWQCYQATRPETRPDLDVEGVAELRQRLGLDA